MILLETAYVYIIGIVLGYLFGSIPNALIIGLKFFNKDIRNYGSHNLGGTNAGRVLGYKAGIIVITLDILKVFFVMYLLSLICIYCFNITPSNINYSNILLITGVLAIFGHCFPIFAGFKGGKAVATLMGFALCTNWMVLIVIVISFFTVLLITKKVSLSSLSFAVLGTIASFIPLVSNAMIFDIQYSIFYPITFMIGAIILIIRHSQNIVRLIHNEERNVNWLSKKK